MSASSFKKDNPGSAASDLEQIRKLLIGNEQQQINGLQEQLDKLQVNPEELSKILVEAINLAHQNSQYPLRGALKNPFKEALPEIIREDPEKISSILYPVILPAIKKSISATLKNFMDSIDRKLKRNFSSESIRLRYEAIRTGTPYSEVLIRNSTEYSIEQILLIHKETGFLIDHVYSAKKDSVDIDTISSMLSAIQMFVNDSFSEEDEDLGKIDFGEHTIFISHGPHALLAVVANGTPPVDFYDRMSSALGNIHRVEGKVIAEYDGTLGLFKSTELLQELYETDDVEEAKKRSLWKKKSTLFLAGVGSIIFLLVAMSIFSSVEKNKSIKLITGHIASVDGYQVIDSNSKDNEILVLKEHTAIPIDEVTLDIKSHILVNDIELNVVEYFSLQQAIIEHLALLLPKGVSVLNVDLGMKKINIIHDSSVSPNNLPNVLNFYNINYSIVVSESNGN